jgi:hypothetical protein|tara:strand:- start:117 stop:524 length:408 start_codon:yes stop_codon:yes gene_type:complete
MAFLPELGTYLAANVSAVTLTLGTNLFLGRLPDTPDTCVAIFETAGLAGVDAGGGSTLPAYTRPRAQALVRAAAYADAASLAEDIYKQVQKIDNESLSGVRYLRAEGMQSPFYLERDGQERAVFSCNYQTLRVLT